MIDRPTDEEIGNLPRGTLIPGCPLCDGAPGARQHNHVRPGGWEPLRNTFVGMTCSICRMILPAAAFRDADQPRAPYIWVEYGVPGVQIDPTRLTDKPDYRAEVRRCVNCVEAAR
ncbi:MAG TPA: hypothetical protein VHV82_02555 [Sporichthyaceae bacterium]|jgi:hypothetical protein|nr:hypothetical protein [Sporichthyaceae bacterium]